MRRGSLFTRLRRKIVFQIHFQFLKALKFRSLSTATDLLTFSRAFAQFNLVTTCGCARSTSPRAPLRRAGGERRCRTPFLLLPCVDVNNVDVVIKPSTSSHQLLSPTRSHPPRSISTLRRSLSEEKGATGPTRSLVRFSLRKRCVLFFPIRKGQA